MLRTMAERVNLAADLASLDDVQVKVLAPRPVEVGLELLLGDLMGRVRALKEVTRGELVGALVLGAVRDAAALPELVSAYRTAKVHELFPGETRQTGTRTLPPRLPGRPRRRPR
jgi:hypothetical protein